MLILLADYLIKLQLQVNIPILGNLYYFLFHFCSAKCRNSRVFRSAELKGVSGGKNRESYAVV